MHPEPAVDADEPEVVLWAALAPLHDPAAPRPDGRALAGWLRAVAARPPAERWVFAADACAAARDPDPAVRSAALAVLAGARGHPALQAMVAGLGDGEAEVRAAAGRALRASAEGEPALALHLLASEEAAVVERLFDAPVPPVRVPLLLRLCADEAWRPRVLAGLAGGEIPVPTSQLSWVLETFAAGHLPPPDLAALLRRLDLAANLGPVVQGLGSGRPARRTLSAGEPVVGPRWAEGEAERAADHADPLDDLVAAWVALLRAGEDPALGALLAAAHRGALPRGPEVRLSLAALVHLYRARRTEAAVPEEILRLALLHHPGVLGWDPVPRSQRVAALRWLAGHRRPFPAQVDPARCRALDLLPPTGIDLGVIAGLCALGRAEDRRRLLSAWSTEELARACLAAPDAAVALLGFPDDALGRTDRQDRVRLLRAAAAEDPVAGGVLVAGVGLRAPRGAARVLDRPAPATRAALAWLDREAEALPTRKVERLAGAVADAARQPLALARAVLCDWEGEGVASRRLVRDVLLVAEGPAIVAALGPEGLSRLAVLDGDGLLPFAVLAAIARAVDDDATAVPEAVAAWLAPARAAAARPRVRPHRRRVGTRALTGAEREAIARAGGSATPLHEALAPALAGPVTGLVDALEDRSLGPDPAVCAALLLCDDPLPTVDALLAASGLDDARLARGVDDRLVPAFGHAAADLSLPAAAWLHRWEAPIESFRRRVDAAGGLAAVLGAALGLRCRALRAALWQAGRRLVGRARHRGANGLDGLLDDSTVDLCVAVLSGRGSDPTDRWPAGDEDREAVQLAAARIVADGHAAAAAGRCGVDVAARLPAVALALPAMPRQARLVLGRVVRVDGVRSRRSVRAAALEGDPAEAIEAAVHPAQVAPWLGTPSQGAAELALVRLADWPEAGAAVVLAALLDPDTPHRALLSQAIADWPEGPSLAGARAAAADPARPPWVRLSLALGLCERGGCERGRGSGLSAPPLCWAVDALRAPPVPGEGAWLEPETMSRLLAVVPDAGALARAALSSPEEVATAAALDRLLPRAASPEVQALLVAFLRRRFRGRSPGHPPDQRLRVARALLVRGVGVGAVLPALHSFAEARRRPTDRDLRGWSRDLAGADLERITRAALADGGAWASEDLLADGIEAPWVPARDQARAATRVVQQTRSERVQGRLLPRATDAAARRHVARRLAEVFAWGRAQGLRITGRLYRIELIGGQALGWTRLQEQRIYVNPVPMLRGERGGRAVLEGLVLHELGHHAFNADAQGRAVWARAGAAGLARLHNLVCDEHLERNLRARDPGWGKRLKTLAAHAFQHGHRELDAVALLSRLGPDGLAVLRRSQLGSGRTPGRVVVGLGALLRGLEGQAGSFARFVRALRMGLGNRHGDPVVAEALALFDRDFRGRDFRDLDNEGLWEVTLALHRIFGGDARRVLELVDLHEGQQADACEVGEATGGARQEEIDREVERIEREAVAPPEGGGRGGGAGGRDVVNVGGGRDFYRITNVVPLAWDKAAAAALAREVARPARKLRDELRRLGLGQVDVRPRIRGHRLDRSRLLALAVRGDPRVLVARKTVHRADLFIGLAVDCSGSMSAGGRMDRARRFAAVVAEACRDLDGVDLRVLGFTAHELYDAGDARRCAAHALEAGGGNNDAAGLWHLAALAGHSRRSARLLVMVSDGLPTDCTTTALRGLVHDLERRRGMVCAQVAVAPLVEHCFDHYIEVTDDDVDAAVRAFSRVVGGLVARTLSG